MKGTSVHTTKVYLRVSQHRGDGAEAAPGANAWTVDEDENTLWSVKGGSDGAAPGQGAPKTPALKRFSASSATPGASVGSLAACPYTPMVQRSAAAVTATPRRRSSGRMTPGAAASGAGGSSFAFDHVFPEQSSQESVFDELQPLVDASLRNGYNGTIFAFGQAGTGKTFTMFGDLDDYHDAGIVPRALEHAFEQGLGHRQQIRVSMLESGGAGFHDLLEEGTEHNCLPATVDSSDPDAVRAAAWPVRSFAEATGVLARGLGRQAKFRILQQQRWSVDGHRRGDDDHDDHGDESNDTGSLEPVPAGHTLVFVFVDGPRFNGRLTFVDLAGARPLSSARTDADVDAIRRANCSLAALGETLAALSSARYDGPLPYSSDPLVSALADSLGFNSRTAFLITADLSRVNFSETLLSCMYATRARRIRSLTSTAVGGGSSAAAAAAAAAEDDREAAIDRLVHEAGLNHAVLETTVRECHRLEEQLLDERRTARAAAKRTERERRARASDMEWTRRQHEQQLSAVRIDRARIKHEAAVAEIRAQSVASELIQCKLDLLMAAEFAADYRSKQAGVDFVVRTVDVALSPGGAGDHVDEGVDDSVSEGVGASASGRRRRARGLASASPVPEADVARDASRDDQEEGNDNHRDQGDSGKDYRKLLLDLKKKYKEQRDAKKKLEELAEDQKAELQRHAALVDRTAPLRKKISRADATALAQLEEVAIALKADLLAKDRRVERLTEALRVVQEQVRQQHLVASPALINYNQQGELEEPADDDDDDEDNQDSGHGTESDAHETEDELIETLQAEVNRGSNRRQNRAKGKKNGKSGGRRRGARASDRKKTGSAAGATKKQAGKTRRAPPSTAPSPSRPVPPPRKARAISVVPSPLEEELEQKMAQATISFEKPIPRSSLDSSGPSSPSVGHFVDSPDRQVREGSERVENSPSAAATVVAAAAAAAEDVSPVASKPAARSLMDAIADGDRRPLSSVPTNAPMAATGAPSDVSAVIASATAAVSVAAAGVDGLRRGPMTMSERAALAADENAAVRNIRPPNAGPRVMGPGPTKSVGVNLGPSGESAAVPSGGASAVARPKTPAAAAKGKKRWNAAEFLISPPRVYPTGEKQKRNKKKKAGRKAGKAIKAAPTLDELLRTGTYVIPKLK